MGDGIFVEGTGTGSQNLNVQGPITLANNVGDAVQHGSDAANTTDNDVTVNNATITSPPAAGGGPTCALSSWAAASSSPPRRHLEHRPRRLTNNNIQNSCIGAIAVGTTGSVGDQQSAQVDATIQNNTIGTAGVAGSGSVQGNGIFVDSNGNGLVRALITGNVIRQWTNRSGIALDVIDGDAEMSATIRNNILTEPNSAFAGTTTRGMTIQLGTAQVGDTIDACLDIGHATDAALKNQVAGTGEPPQPDIRYLHEGQGSVVQLAGYSGPTAPAIGNIVSYLQPRNNLGGTPTVSGIATASPVASTTTGAASLSASGWLASPTPDLCLRPYGGLTAVGSRAPLRICATTRPRTGAQSEPGLSGPTPRLSPREVRHSARRTVRGMWKPVRGMWE